MILAYWPCMLSSQKTKRACKLSNMKKKLPSDVLRFFQETGRQGGKIGGSIGGKRAAESMTPEERSGRARKAAAASARVRSKQAKRSKRNHEEK